MGSGGQSGNAQSSHPIPFHSHHHPRPAPTVKRLRGRKGEAQSDETHCLVRAKAGKRRISTTVPDAEAENFRAELAVVRACVGLDASGCVCVCFFFFFFFFWGCLRGVCVGRRCVVYVCPDVRHYINLECWRWWFDRLVALLLLFQNTIGAR